MTPDIPRLLSLTADLESGHPIEEVLARHGIPHGYSAYEVVRRLQQNREYHRTATTDFYRKYWAKATKELEPVVEAIAKELEQ